MRKNILGDLSLPLDVCKLLIQQSLHFGVCCVHIR
jgi:hypothetical protein